MKAVSGMETLPEKSPLTTVTKSVDWAVIIRVEKSWPTVEVINHHWQP